MMMFETQGRWLPVKASAWAATAISLSLLLCVPGCNSEPGGSLAVPDSRPNFVQAVGSGLTIPTGDGPEPMGRPVAGSLEIPTPAFSDSLDTRSLQLTRAALVLAGMKEEALRAGARLPESEIWQKHSRQLGRVWKRQDASQFSKIRRWADQELKPMASQVPLVYYPFSGPDFLYVSALFPRAQAYVLTGLEPVGDIIPTDELPDSELADLLPAIGPQLQDILGLTFFRTDDLKKAQENPCIVGILFVFLARTGHEILDAQHVYIDKQAALRPLDPEDQGKIDPRLVRGIRIVFRRKGESVLKVLLYFSADLSNAGLKEKPEYLELLRRWPRFFAFLKATSYLVQYQTFTALRRFLLDRSLAVLQDDSGIALKLYDPAQWSLAFYGHYVGPIDKWAEFFQDDLKDAYLTNPVKPLNFGIGYRFQPSQSCLMLAVRREKDGHAD
jgi:hypothetical protein